MIQSQRPIPTWSLELDHVERYAYVKNLFTKDECEWIINYIKENNKLSEGTILSTEEIINPEIRESNIAFISPEESLYWMYSKLTNAVITLNNDFFKFDLFGFTEGLQFTEYIAPTGHYDQHVDRAFGMGSTRKLSIVLQLTEDTTYEGGDFELLDSSTPTKLFRDQGTLLAFPSYTLHRVTPVTKGIRHSLVGWVSGKPFK